LGKPENVSVYVKDAIVGFSRGVDVNAETLNCPFLDRSVLLVVEFVNVTARDSVASVFPTPPSV
jgi:hypothetical protein